MNIKRAEIRREVQARVFRNDCTNAEFVTETAFDALWKPFLETSRIEPNDQPITALDLGDVFTIDIEGFSIPARIQPTDRQDLHHPSFDTSIR